MSSLKHKKWLYKTMWPFFALSNSSIQGKRGHQNMTLPVEEGDPARLPPLLAFDTPELVLSCCERRPPRLSGRVEITPPLELRTSLARLTAPECAPPEKVRMTGGFCRGSVSQVALVSVLLTIAGFGKSFFSPGGSGSSEDAILVTLRRCAGLGSY